jgi:hypothetical protein
MIKLIDLLKEELSNKTIEISNKKIDELPSGKIFSDSKNIQGIFNTSQYSWSEVIEKFEKIKKQGKLEDVDIMSIHITQPNIQSNKVKHLIKNINNLPYINIIQFKNGEKVIYDGHHRLVANWALGKKLIKAYLVKL